MGEDFPVHRPVGVVGISADDCDSLCNKIEQINAAISILDENGENMIIRYTDFDYLKENYRKGLEAY